MPSIVRARLPNELKIIPNGDPVIFAEGRIGAIVQYPVLVDEGQGYVAKTFEKFVRSPGSRIIAVRDNKIYLQKEARLETNDFDWRLPGGKVVDTFTEYKNYFGKAIPESVVIAAAQKELREEAGLTSENITLLTKKVCGATVEWDLYYVIAKDVTTYTADHAHTEGEEVSESNWFTFEEIKKMCEQGSIGEGRTAAALIEFISK